MPGGRRQQGLVDSLDTLAVSKLVEAVGVMQDVPAQRMEAQHMAAHLCIPAEEDNV